NLESLNLHANNIGTPGARALAKSTCLPRLMILRLSSNKIRRDGGMAMAGSSWMNQLTLLDVNTNHLGTAGRDLLRKHFKNRVQVCAGAQAAGNGRSASASPARRELPGEEDARDAGRSVPRRHLRTSRRRCPAPGLRRLARRARPAGPR